MTFLIPKSKSYSVMFTSSSLLSARLAELGLPALISGREYYVNHKGCGGSGAGNNRAGSPETATITDGGNTTIVGLDSGTVTYLGSEGASTSSGTDGWMGGYRRVVTGQSSADYALNGSSLTVERAGAPEAENSVPLLQRSGSNAVESGALDGIAINPGGVSKYPPYGNGGYGGLESKSSTVLIGASAGSALAGEGSGVFTAGDLTINIGAAGTNSENSNCNGQPGVVYLTITEL